MIEIAKPYEILSSDDLYKLHTATLEILDRVGVRVEDDTALKLLFEVGAEVNFDKKLAKIPRHLIDEAENATPRTCKFAGRERKNDLTLGGRKLHFGMGEGATTILDSTSGIVRAATMKDIAAAAKLADGLSNIDFVMPIFTAGDAPIQSAPLHGLYQALRNTEKPVMVVDYGLDAIHLIRLASVIVGGEEKLTDTPILGMYSEPISPLTHGKSHTKNLMTFARHKLPIVYIPSPAAGSTAPATIAGAIVQSNAETLSGNVIAQFTRKGAQYIYGFDTSIFDQRTGAFPYGSPEWMLHNIILAQLGRYYGFPTWSTGGCSDSKMMDQQAAIEATLTLFIAAQSGANLIHDVGAFLSTGMTGCLDLLTIDDEILSMITRILSGFKINDETLAIDVISKVGPGGNYIAQEHTRNFFKTEHWFPTLMDRQVRETWTKTGAKDLLQRAQEKTKHILDTHVVPPLSNEVEKELAATLDREEQSILQTR